jgi:hypothetical protein
MTIGSPHFELPVDLVNPNPCGVHHETRLDFRLAPVPESVSEDETPDSIGVAELPTD